MGKVENVNPERRRQRYTREFKLEAVRLLKREQKSATQLALELDVRRNSLYKWAEQLKDKGEGRAFPGSGARPLAQRSEIERLRRELKRVTEERDILKKAQAYFAKGRR